MRRLFVFYIVFFSLISCSYEGDKGKLLATVNDNKLYQADIKEYLVEQEYTLQDSARLADEFIKNWVDEQILMQAARDNKKIDREKIEQKTEQFKRDLYILELEQLLVDERLDTNITDNEIKKYYEQNPDEFQLNDYLVKVLYIKVPVDAPDIDQIGNKYKLYKEKDIAEIEVYAKIYATNYYYDPANWIYFDDLLKEIPLQDINKDSFIMKRSKIRFEENGYHYFLNILDYKLKNTLSPLSFEKNNIKERILNMRIKTLRETIKADIIKEAHEKNSVKIY